VSTEQLIIELDAKTSKLDAKLKKVERKLDDVDDATKRADVSLKDYGNAAKVAGSALLKTAGAVLALGSAITAMTLKAASSRKELEQFARQAKTSEENFQSLAFATKQYGINAEQIADISKDISDKVGEFSAAGTGAFQDYADVMKLTKEEARAVATEFQSLSGEEVIGEMVSQLEAAGASGDRITFVLESMGNDLSRLKPLFAENSKGLKELKERFTDVNESMDITASQAEGLKEVSTSFDLMASSIGKASTAISATLAPVVDDFFNDIIRIVPDATQTIIDFANSLLDAADINSEAAILKEIAEANFEIAEATKRQANDVRGLNGLHAVTIMNERERLVELNAQLEVLREQRRLEDARRGEGGEIGGEVGASTATSDSSGTGDEIQEIEDRFKTEEHLLSEKLVRELQIIGDNNELKLELEREFSENINEIREKAADDKSKIDLKASKAEEKIESLKRSFAGRTAQTLLSSASSTQEKLFSIVKDTAAGQIEAYGLTAGARALAELGPIAGPPVAASYIGWSQVAAGVVRALPLGGSGGGAGNPGDGAATSPQQQESFTPETSDIGLDFRTDDASSVQVIRFDTETGDQLIDALSGMLNENMRQGRG